MLHYISSQVWKENHLFLDPKSAWEIRNILKDTIICIYYLENIKFTKSLISIIIESSFKISPETLQRPLNQALYVLQTYFRISL
jgi:hypothetical protein